MSQDTQGIAVPGEPPSSIHDVPVQAVSLEHLRAHLRDEKHPFYLRTSDRILFKRCRRLWGWMSHLRQGRRLLESADYLWFGSGIHYALEDYHGLNLYEHPSRAFLAYVMAASTSGTLPGTWQEHKDLGIALMSYYADHWLPYRSSLDTYEINGIPQVEVNGAIDLGVRTADGRRVMYGFTIDRMAVDEHSRLWIVEYKTAKQARLYHFDTDDQVTAYCWAAWHLYGVLPAGVVYQQFVKKLPSLPKILATGKISTDTRQATSAALYAKMMRDMYGSEEDAPPENITALNRFRSMEDEDKDKFVVRHRIERNEQQLISFQEKVMMELEDIANPNLPLYPNPTKDCEWMCPLQAACIAMDDGSDWEKTLSDYSVVTGDVMTQRETEQLRWRDMLPEPQDVVLREEDIKFQQLLGQLTVPDSGEQITPEEAFMAEIGMS